MVVVSENVVEVLIEYLFDIIVEIEYFIWIVGNVVVYEFCCIMVCLVDLKNYLVIKLGE